MSSPFSFSDWPPELSKEELVGLTLQATTYAFGRSLLYLPTGEQPPAPTSAIHAPIALFPSPFPRRLFRLVQKLQNPYNVLYARVAMDWTFLDRVMGEEGIANVDEFVGQLWSKWKALRNEGPFAQPLQLGLFRSDYIVHKPSADAEIGIKQVEFNTIASSFGALAQQTAGLHKYLCANSQYYNKSPDLILENLPVNETISGLVEGLSEGHKAYGVPSAYILFVVQAGERNMFDHKLLEYELLDKYGIRVIRQTFNEIPKSATMDPHSKALYITPPLGLLPSTDRVEISTIYFRAGYTTIDYTEGTEYGTRLFLERTRAIKCPSLALQLAGGKKVQEVLTHPGVLESFLCDKERWGEEAFSQEIADEIRTTWMNMWSLDFDDSNTPHPHEGSGMRMARERAMSLVIKPQREGGGNNVYKGDIAPFLDKLPADERPAHIAMDLIVPPPGTSNYLVRAGTGESVLGEVVSELGVYGYALFGGSSDIKEKEIGWLVRTKSKDSNEGGVATGFSVLDSAVLIDA